MAPRAGGRFLDNLILRRLAGLGLAFLLTIHRETGGVVIRHHDPEAPGMAHRFFIYPVGDRLDRVGVRGAIQRSDSAPKAVDTRKFLGKC